MGTIDGETLRPLVEQYLATLPVGDKNKGIKDHDLKINKEKTIVHFTRDMEIPKILASNLYSDVLNYNQKNKIALNIFNQVLDLLFTRTIRQGLSP